MKTQSNNEIIRFSTSAFYQDKTLPKRKQGKINKNTLPEREQGKIKKNIWEPGKVEEYFSLMYWQSILCYFILDFLIRFNH